MDIDECASKPCGPNGNCSNLQNSFNCTCDEEFDGKLCENNINDCQNVTCNGHGVCVDLVNSFECKCLDGFNGTM